MPTGNGAWARYKQLNNTDLSLFQPFMALNLTADEEDNKKLLTNNDSVSDSILFSRKTFKDSNSKTDETDFDAGVKGLNVYGGIDSVVINKTDLKYGRTDVTVVIKTFISDVFNQAFFQALLTIGTHWTLTYGWYISTIPDVFREQLSLTVQNFDVKFNNDGTYDITVQLTNKIWQTLYATNMVMVGKALSEAIEKLKTEKPLTISMLCDAIKTVINTGTAGERIKFDIRGELNDGRYTGVRFKIYEDAQFSGNEYFVTKVADIPLKYNSIMNLIVGTGGTPFSISKILLAITNPDYFETIIGATIIPKYAIGGGVEVYFALTTDATNDTIYIFNRYSSEFNKNKYSVEWASASSLIESLSYSTEYSITELIQHQRAFVRNIGNEVKISGGQLTDGSGKGIAGIVKIFCPVSENLGPATAPTESYGLNFQTYLNYMGTGAPAVPPTIQTYLNYIGTGAAFPLTTGANPNKSTQSIVRFQDIINSYFNLAEINIFGTPGVELFHRMQITSFVPTQVVGSDYHIIGVTHTLNKSSFRTNIKARLMVFD